METDAPGDHTERGGRPARRRGPGVLARLDVTDATDGTDPMDTPDSTQDPAGRGTPASDASPAGDARPAEAAAVQAEVAAAQAETAAADAELAAARADSAFAQAPATEGSDGEQSLLRLVDIGKNFGPVRVLSHISVDFPAAQVT